MRNSSNDNYLSFVATLHATDVKMAPICYKISAYTPSLVLENTTFDGSKFSPILAKPTKVIAHSDSSIGKSVTL